MGTTEFIGVKRTACSPLPIAHMAEARADHASVSGASPLPPPVQPRALFSHSPLPPPVPSMGLAFAIGGRDGSTDLSSVSVLDVVAASIAGHAGDGAMRSWQQGCVPDLPRPRSALTACCVADTAIIAMGGWERPDEAHTGLADVNLLGLASWKEGNSAWTTCANMPTPRMFLSSVEMTERHGSVFVLGGSIAQLDRFHVGENRWCVFRERALHDVHSMSKSSPHIPIALSPPPPSQDDVHLRLVRSLGRCDGTA